MTLLALDIASRTGYCLWRPAGPHEAPTVSCGSWHCHGGDFDEKCEELSDYLTNALRWQRQAGHPVTRAAIEAPIRRLPTKRRRLDSGEEVDELASNPNTMLILPALIGSACAILHQFKVPKIMVAPATWRKTVLGTGRAPKGKGSSWFKAEMRIRAELLGDRLGFKVPNHDASDAVGIALWLAGQTGRLPAGVLTGRGPNLFAQAAE